MQRIKLRGVSHLSSRCIGFDDALGTLPVAEGWKPLPVASPSGAHVGHFLPDCPVASRLPGPFREHIRTLAGSANRATAILPPLAEQAAFRPSPNRPNA
jgi:hypothetical protein